MANLNDEHRHMLEKESGISPDVIEERGYLTVKSVRQAEGLGFPRNQAKPGLGLPIYSPGTGELAGYQLRRITGAGLLAYSLT